MDQNKRKDIDGAQDSSNNQSIVLKKQKTEDLAITPSAKSSNAIIESTIPRTSKLQAPIMLLSGHKRVVHFAHKRLQAEVYSIRFDPSGERLLSSSFDKTISLWNVYGDCENYAVLKGHSNAVMEANWTNDGHYIVSCSADKSFAFWDASTALRIKKFTGHTAIVNAVANNKRGPLYVVTGSDDKTVRFWDVRNRKCTITFNNQYPALSVAISDQAEQVFTAGIDNVIKQYDIRKPTEPILVLSGHEDSITGIKLSPDSSYLLSNSMDGSVRIWDIRPFVQGQRGLKFFYGIQHNFEKNLLRCCWSPDGTKISAGSADRFVYIWDTTTKKILYKLPGHKGSVNDVDFHPKEPIVGSASSDKTIFLGEIKSQDLFV